MVPADSSLWKQESIAIMQAASGDLGTLFKTLAEVPKGAKSLVVCMSNDTDFIVNVRNLVILLISLHSRSSMVTMSEVIMHFWYSYFISDGIIAVILEAIFPTLLNFAKAAAGHPKHALLEISLLHGVDQDRKIILVTTPHTIFGASELFNTDSLRMSPARMEQVQGLFRDQNNIAGLHDTKPAWRTSKMRYAERGVVLPMAQSARDFQRPNPTMFVNNEFVDIGCQPIDGWNIEEVLQIKCNAPSNDLYGKFLLYMRSVIARAIVQIRLGNVGRIILTQIDFVGFDFRDPAVATRWQGNFDRIDITNIDVAGSSDDFGEIVSSWKPMLKDAPTSAFLYRCRLANSGDLLPLHIGAISSSLDIGPTVHLDEWSTNMSSPKTCLVQCKMHEYEGSEESQVDTPRGSPVGPCNSPNPDNQDNPESYSQSVVTALNSIDHTLPPRCQSFADSAFQAAASESAEQRLGIPQATSQAAELTERHSLPTPRAGNKISASALDEHSLASAAATTTLVNTVDYTDSIGLSKVSSSPILKAVQ